MLPLTINYKILYDELVVRVMSIGYSSFEAPTNLNAHQTINLIIYQLQLILGEVTYENNSGYWSRLLKKFRDLYWSYKGITFNKVYLDVRSKSADPPSFPRDKKILIDKLTKLFIHPEDEKLSNHCEYGRLSKDQSLLLIFRIIDYYLKPFEFLQVSK
jgi:hypothetical protein